MNENVFQPNIFSKVSHEIRLPLTGIFGMIHFLEQTSLNPKQQEYLNNMLESAQRLLTAEANICALLKQHIQEKNS